MQHEANIHFRAEDFWEDGDPHGYHNSIKTFYNKIREHAGADKPLYFFGYGSLMWKHDDLAPDMVIHGATLQGWRRDVIQSTATRGTPEAPGMVLTVSKHDASSVVGSALYVSPERSREAFDVFVQRELVAENDIMHGDKQHGMYSMAFGRITLPNLNEVDAIIVTTNPKSLKATTHIAYKDIHVDGDITDHQKAIMIVSGQHAKGEIVNRSMDYFQNTLDSLQEMGIQDPHMESLDQAVTELNPLYEEARKMQFASPELAEQAREQLMALTNGFITIDLSPALKLREHAIMQEAGLEVNQLRKIILSEKNRKKTDEETRILEDMKRQKKDTIQRE